VVERNFEQYKKDNHGITWKEYVDLRFSESEKALRIATAEMNRRLEGMNEIRSQLDRQASTFVSRDALDGVAEKMSDRIQACVEKVTSESARNKAYTIIVSASVSMAVGIIVGLVVAATRK
jgi:hypothetical protein